MSNENFTLKGRRLKIVSFERKNVRSFAVFFCAAFSAYYSSVSDGSRIMEYCFSVDDLLLFVPGISVDDMTV